MVLTHNYAMLVPPSKMVLLKWVKWKKKYYFPALYNILDFLDIFSIFSGIK